jgi:hypothetical protein
MWFVIAPNSVRRRMEVTQSRHYRFQRYVGRGIMVMMVRACAGEPGIPPVFPLLLDTDMALIEPAFAWLIEHAVLRGRGRAAETVRT